MVVAVFFDGIKDATSQKGTHYADVFYREMQDNGEPDFEQKKVRTFNEGVISACSALKSGDCCNLDLLVRDATLVGVSR